jgi:magnesium-transporting ATPase (P-type)
MSVVLEMPDGTFVLLCKGADNVMLDRAAGKVMDQVEIKAQLRKFSQQGLRTLVMAKRTISKDEFETWIKGFEQASASLKNRKEMLAEAAESIEKNMEIVGASAIEDKLQDGVPDTIEDIRKAGIKLWVLTGDKVETAINIGLSCKLLLPEEKGMRTLLLDIAEEADAVDEFLERVDIDVLRRYVDEVLTKGLSCKAPTTNDLLMWRLVATSFSRMVEREKSQRSQTLKVKHMKLETIRNAMLQIRVESDLREIVQEIEIARGTLLIVEARSARTLLFLSHIYIYTLEHRHDFGSNGQTCTTYCEGFHLKKTRGIEEE